MNTPHDKATARPWRIGDAGLTVFGPPNGNPSPETVAHTSRANAALIIAAVNAYDAHRALVAPLRAALEDYDSHGFIPEVILRTLRDALAAVDAATRDTVTR